MHKVRLKADLSTFQKQELAKYFLDLSKLVVGSMIIKLFELKDTSFAFESVVTLLAGLTVSIILVIIALVISNERKGGKRK
jgi:hypothetical protein